MTIDDGGRLVRSEFVGIHTSRHYHDVGRLQSHQVDHLQRRELPHCAFIVLDRPVRVEFEVHTLEPIQTTQSLGLVPQLVHTVLPFDEHHHIP